MYVFLISASPHMTKCDILNITYMDMYSNSGILLYIWTHNCGEQSETLYRLVGSPNLSS